MCLFIHVADADAGGGGGGDGSVVAAAADDDDVGCLVVVCWHIWILYIIPCRLMCLCLCMECAGARTTNTRIYILPAIALHKHQFGEYTSTEMDHSLIYLI